MSATAVLFYELFRGREDVVLLDDGNGKPFQHKLENPEDEDVHGHIANSLLYDCPSVGIYSLLDGSDCRWICSDFDDEHAADNAFRLAQCWMSYGITPFIESSKSKGYHVWAFIADWCPGIIARRAALWVHEVANVEAKEVNPKQELTDGYGNCVRLPYWSGRGEGRMEVYRDIDSQGFGDPYTASEFAHDALSNRVTVNDLKKLAVKWQPPAPPERGEVGAHPAARDFSGEVTDLPCRDIFKGNAPVPAGDRDNSLHAVANYMRGSNVDYSEAVQIMTEIWHDQVEQPPGDMYPLKTAIDKVRRAYQNGR